MAKCPICKSETVHDFRPFCSRRCADLDLGKWLTGSYAVPVEDDDEDAQTPGDAEPITKH